MKSLMAFACIYVVVFSLVMPSYIDEAYTLNLAADKNMVHMLTALRHGADGSFPLYILIAFFLQKLFGSSEFILRLSSSLFVLGFAWHSGTRLAPYFGRIISFLTVSFVLVDGAFTFYTIQIRCYGLLMLLFCLCFWSTWDLLRDQNSSIKRLLYHALVCGLLCLCHPLGLVYAGVLGLLYVTFSVRLRSFALRNAVAFLGGPALFLMWLPCFLDQRIVNPVYHPDAPGWLKYWRFAFFGSPWLFLTLVLGCIAAVVVRVKAEGRKPDQLSGHNSNNRLLVIYSVAFIIGFNVVALLLDVFHIIPMYWYITIRYGLVCWVAYAVIVAAILTSVLRLLRPVRGGVDLSLPEPAQFAIALLAVLVLFGFNAFTAFTTRAESKAFFTRVSQMAQEGHLPVICQSHMDAFYLATHTAERVQYILSDDFEYKRLLLQIAKYYPRPEPISAETQSHYTNEYLFVSSWPRDAWIVGKP